MPRHIAILILTAAVAATATACGGNDGNQDTASESKVPSVADLSRGVVQVQSVYADGQTKEATGVVIDANQGLVLTANHAMENAPNINVRLLSNGALTHARQGPRAQCHDLAMLKLLQRPPGLSQIRLGDSDAVSVGEPVRTLTFRQDSSGPVKGRPALDLRIGTVTTPHTSATFPPLPRMRSLIAHQSALAAGASGSPILDAEGKMIGINTFVAHPRDPGIDGVEYALESNYIRRRLNELEPGSSGLPAGWGDEHNKCHRALHNLLGKGHVHVPYSAEGTKEGATP
jgi:putative serine protease PepD